MKIELSGYKKFLAEIQNHLKQSQSEIINTVTRQKVVMSWQIGQSLDVHLHKNNRAGYGEKLFDQLAQDIAISKRDLYRMRSFYQAYPTLPKNDSNLNWSHYRALSNLKEKSQRKYFEKLTQQQNWDVKTLEFEIKNVEPGQKNVEKISKKSGKVTTKNQAKTIRAQRGELFIYPTVQLEDSSKNYLDLGFKIFTESPGGTKNLPAIVEVTKKDEKFLLTESAATSKKLHTYKATLERVVDGDTIRVILDLGFGIKHREIIRLAKINAAEIRSAEGKKASDELKKILRNVPFLILKTFQTDIYGRYIADVFFDEKKEKNTNPQQVAKEGIYLNQLLLEKGLVELY